MTKTNGKMIVLMICLAIVNAELIFHHPTILCFYWGYIKQKFIIEVQWFPLKTT